MHQLVHVVRGAPPRKEREEIVLFELAAMYSWDLPIIRWAYDWAASSGVGTAFSFSSRHGETG